MDGKSKFLLGRLDNLEINLKLNGISKLFNLQILFFYKLKSKIFKFYLVMSTFICNMKTIRKDIWENCTIRENIFIQECLLIKINHYIILQ